MKLLLSEPLPLRTTRMLGNYADDAILPHRYGDLTSGRFKLIRLDDVTFFVADHPMEVTGVYIDAQRYDSWKQEIRSDAFGHTWTVIVIAAPAPLEAQLSAIGKGKRNARTGALIENPADIVEDILLLGGRMEYRFDALRAECSANDLRLAGSIDAALSTFDLIDDVMSSAGAIWAPPNMARLYPTQTIIGPIKTLGPLQAFDAFNVQARAMLQNTADILRLSYDPDAIDSASQHFIELTANPMRFGSNVLDRSGEFIFQGLPRALLLSWLRTPSNAESVGRRLLPWFAGERYDVTFDSDDATIRPGQWVTLEGRAGLRHPEWPIDSDVDPTIMILGVDVTPRAQYVHCAGKALISAPAINVTGHSIALPTTTGPGVEVAIKDGVATFIVRDKDRKPIIDALVNIDGGEAHKTNSTGSVQFPATKGKHVLGVQAPGKLANTIDIEL